MKLVRMAAVATVALALAACGDGNDNNNDLGGNDLSAGGGEDLAGSGMVMGHARILHGPSTVMHSKPFRRRTGGGQPQLADGTWAISPNSATLSVANLSFQGTTPGVVHQIDLTGCMPAYQRDAPSLTDVLDCPFAVPADSYGELGIGVSATYSITIDDIVNDLYTDPTSATKLTTTRPTGGGQPVTITGTAPGGIFSSSHFFGAPVVLTANGSIGGDDGGAVTGVQLDLIEDMIHTVFVTVSGGTPSFATNASFSPVQMVASVEGAGHVEFYTDSGTAGNVANEMQTVRVFYNGRGEAAYLWHPILGPSQAWNVDPATAPVTNGNRAGGYLGIDSTGTLCWAHPVDGTYGTYKMLCEMSVVANVGDTTTLRCQNMTAVPAPTSGSTYASGCPAITPDTTATLTLVAR